MAEDLVFSAISKFTSLYQDELNLFQSVNIDRKIFESNLQAIKAVLHEAEKKQLTGKYDPLNHWLQGLKEVVYELDDILDDCAIEDIRDEFEGDRSCAFLGFLHPQKVIFRHNISGKMKEIQNRLEFITKEKDQFNFVPVEKQPDSSHSNISQWRQTTSFVAEDEIFGRAQDKEFIVHHLLEGASTRDTLYVYPIVGVGGLGKTTLAQLVYGDQRVTKHFEIKKWICVSDNFDLKRLVKAIINSNESLDELDVLGEKLRAMLQPKRYLIVLDDVWNEDLEKWRLLRSFLASGSRGSAILITTRLEKVATIMKSLSVQPYHLKSLSEDDCWEIFRKRAFGLSVVAETENLVRIGKQISEKCKGVPLAAKTLGGLLSLETNERVWHIVRDSELWNLPEEQGSIMAALRLSYLNLSSQTRRCFSFCSIFPKDYEVSTLNLIHLWMANGLISEGQSTTMELEDIGEMVVNDLYWRSLIQDVTRDDDSGCIKYFMMHDLVHDLAQSISSHESVAIEKPSSKYLSPGTRHISIACYESESKAVCELLEKLDSLRSLVFLHCSDPVALATSHSLKHTRLRALDWSNFGSQLGELPSSIGVLKHLRYLNLYGSKIKEIPDSIGSLWNLQTLNVQCCTDLKSFPASIGRLKNLRYLNNERCYSLSSMPQSMVGLTSLRTLPFVVVGEYKKNEFHCNGLEHLKYLRGKLKIKHLERVRDVKDGEKANLNEKLDLDDLSLTWSRVNRSGGNNDQQNQIRILEALRPSPKLRILILRNYEGICFPNWMMNEIPNFKYIQSLYLQSCKNSEQLPPLWRLPSLKKLVLGRLSNMRYLIECCEGSCEEQCVYFPALEVLDIQYLRRLQNIISVEKTEEEVNSKDCIIFPCISELSISHCPELNSFSSGPFPSLQSLKFVDCEKVMLSMLTSSSYNLQSFSSLRELTISCFYSLESFPYQLFPGLTSLQKLSINFCSKLKSFPDSIKSLSSLQELTIYDCPELEDISSVILQLASLQKLSLFGLLMKSLDTDTLIDLPSLKCLELLGCPNLESLPNWMTHLTSLDQLSIYDCKELRFMPDSIQQLSKLEDVSIGKCPELERRCMEKTGEDWHKIAHIPYFRVW